MSVLELTSAPVSSERLAEVVRLAGDWLERHRVAVQNTQWIVIAFYALLVVIPVFLPLPERQAHIWNNLTLFAQFMFWGIWWPFVLLSMLVAGRAWCGLFCPEGALSELASRHGRGRAIPRWMTWRGWPFVAFSVTTIYGQMVSIYQYPKPVLLILGGSTAAAIVVGLLYGRNVRVWCRYLCPVNGVFNLLAKLSPLHFKVDSVTWRASHNRAEHPRKLDCAPLVPVRNMTGAGACHMCGRCSGYRGAVQLSVRSPNREIVHLAGSPTRPWETVLLFFGMMGLALGAFQWTNSALFIDGKQLLATWLVKHGIIWPLQWAPPWWLLTDYPEHNDVMNAVDGVVLLAYMIATALSMGSFLSLTTALVTRTLGPWSWQRFHHLAQSYIPLAGCGVFLGLSALTATMLRAEHLSLSWVPSARAGLLILACVWSMALAWQIAGQSAHGLRRMLGSAVMIFGIATGGFAWMLLFTKT